MSNDTEQDTATDWRSLDMSDASPEHLHNLRSMKPAGSIGLAMKRAAAAELQRRRMFGDMAEE